MCESANPPPTAIYPTLSNTIPIVTPSSQGSATAVVKPLSSDEPTMLNPGPTGDGTQKDPSWFSTFTGTTPQQPDVEGNGNASKTAFYAQGAASWLGQRRQSIRPWAEFFKSSKFGLPPVVSAVSRIQHNLSYFFSNYLCIFAVLLIYCILTSFIMLLTLIALGGLIYTIRQRTLKGPVIVGNQELPPSLLYTLAIMVCIPLFALADVGQVMYWVIGSSILVIFLHAALYESEEVPGAEFEVVTVA